jgi:hypothetical protein
VPKRHAGYSHDSADPLTRKGHQNLYDSGYIKKYSMVSIFSGGEPGISCIGGRRVQ